MLRVGVAAALVCAAAPALVAAAPHPPYEGTTSFQPIESPADPEDYSWEVQLDEGQALRAIDERRAEVYYTDDETRAFLIEATLAHDAEGTNVPTTLAVSEGNTITLTVHHRAGNPVAAGAAFVYPVTAGAGWEGGFQPQVIPMPDPKAGLLPAPPLPKCQVPALAGHSLKAARRKLRKAHCTLGPVRGERARGAKVVKQYRKPGRTLRPGSPVGVKLAA